MTSTGRQVQNAEAIQNCFFLLDGYNMPACKMTAKGLRNNLRRLLKEARENGWEEKVYGLTITKGQVDLKYAENLKKRRAVATMLGTLKKGYSLRQFMLGTVVVYGPDDLPNLNIDCPEHVFYSLKAMGAIKNTGQHETGYPFYPYGGRSYEYRAD